VVFSLGIAAWRYDWLRQLEWKHARSWIIYTLPVAWLSMPAVGALGISLNGPGTGLSWTAIGYAFWEPFIASGLIAAWLLVFRRHMNRPSGISTWLNRRSYSVYIIHPVVLSENAGDLSAFRVIIFLREGERPNRPCPNQKTQFINQLTLIVTAPMPLPDAARRLTNANTARTSTTTRTRTILILRNLG
jgi:hypothetical protein